MTSRRRIATAATLVCLAWAVIAAAASVAIALLVDDFQRPLGITLAATLLLAGVAAGGAAMVHVADERAARHRLGQLDRRLERLRSDFASSISLTSGTDRDGAGKLVSVAALDRRLAETSYQLYRQLEARMVIEQHLAPADPLPPMRGFALSPDVALDLVSRVLRGDVRRVLETGSGVSTLLLALALRARGEGGCVYAIEHDEAYAEQTRRLLAEHGCDRLAEVIVAPLAGQVVDGERFDWYDLSAVGDLPLSIDLLLIDGPPASVGPRSRFPAVPLLRETLNPDARIVLDDAKREDERTIVGEWIDRHGVELVAFHRYEKGLAELRLVPPESVPTAVLDRPEHGEVGIGVGADDVPRRSVRPLSADEVSVSVWREPGGERSSFRYKLHESKRRKHLLPLLGHRQRVWGFNDKVSGYRLATSVGVSVPDTYVISTTMSGFDWDAAPDRFVIKPHNGTANRGVFLLQRVVDGEYRDLMDRRTKTVADIVATYEQLVAADLISPRCSVEELLSPRPALIPFVDHPDDFKVYCFYDKPTVVMQRRMFGESDSRRWRFKIWTEDWQDMGPVKFADRYDSSLAAPLGGGPLLEAARRLAVVLAVPFIRLDLFDTDRGPVFGEVSVHPGPPEVWDPAADELLGWEWEMAEARLLAAGISPSEPFARHDQ